MKMTELLLQNLCPFTFKYAQIRPMQGCHSQGKSLENEIFSRSGKSQGILWMAREIKKGFGKSGKSQGI